MARILLCTPSSIDRIRKGETTATPEFSKRIKEVLSYTSIEGGDFEDLRQALDSEYSWYYYLFPDGTFSEDKMEDEYTTVINPNIEPLVHMMNKTFLFLLATMGFLWSNFLQSEKKKD